MMLPKFFLAYLSELPDTQADELLTLIQLDWYVALHNENQADKPFMLDEMFETLRDSHLKVFEGE